MREFWRFTTRTPELVAVYAWLLFISVVDCFAVNSPVRLESEVKRCTKNSQAFLCIK